MKVDVETKHTVITLELNEAEAMWLQAVMQNPIGGIDPPDEPEGERAMRESLWEALNKTSSGKL